MNISNVYTDPNMPARIQCQRAVFDSIEYKAKTRNFLEQVGKTKAPFLSEASCIFRAQAIASSVDFARDASMMAKRKAFDADFIAKETLDPVCEALVWE